MSDDEYGRGADDPWADDPWPGRNGSNGFDGVDGLHGVDGLDGLDGLELPDDYDVRPPMTWHGLPPGPRWSWFDRLWSDVCVLRERYRLAIRSEWWADELQVEVLAAFAAWVQRYDSGEWDDPPGKLALLFDLERVAAALRDGVEPFNPERDRSAFERHLRMLGCRPPPNAAGR
jgi:hypothetical protein